MNRKKQTEPYISKVLHSKGRKLGLPIAGNFELTARCNFNCPMCYVHMNETQIKECGKKELSASEWLEIAEKARDMGMIFVLLTGGEPLMRKDFFEIYEGMKKLGLFISINTNGSLLKGETLEKFIKNPPSRFNISLYGGSNETYAKMCGLPMYDTVKENIKKIRDAGIDVTINLSITSLNCQDLEKIYHDAEELNVNVKATSYMYPSIRINDQQFGCGNRLCASEAAKYSVEWDKLRFTKEEFEIRANNMLKCISLEEGCPVEADEGVRCRAGSTSFWLTWDGRMLPCGMMVEPEAYPLEVGFEEAWKQIRTATSQIRTPKECTTCSYKDICGVCASVCYTETGAFDKVPTYVCEKTKLQLEYTQKLVKTNK